MIEINNKAKCYIRKKEIVALIGSFRKKYRLSPNLSLAIINDAEMRKINKLYRHQDKTTDVLSFLGSSLATSEILISWPQIKRQAKTTYKQEFMFILVHGLLHLAGYNDEEERDRQEMIELGHKFLKY